MRLCLLDKKAKICYNIKRTMTETETTANGYKIEHPVSKIDAAGFRELMAEKYGFEGDNPQERLKRLREMSIEGVAIMLEDINKSVQGSRDSLMNHEEAFGLKTSEGEAVNTLLPEDRYGVFVDLLENIRSCPDETNPSRVGDVLALGVVLLHPFHDGNGRTARLVGLLFHDNYDQSDYEDDYKIVAKPRDDARRKIEFMIDGYIPRLPQGMSQSDPQDVSNYLRGLLYHESEGAYTSCFGQAPLKK